MKEMIKRSIVAGLLLASVAADAGTPDYDIVYVRQVRFGDLVNTATATGQVPGGATVSDSVFGSSLLEGVRLCEPCAYLAKKLGPAVVERIAAMPYQGKSKTNQRRFAGSRLIAAKRKSSFRMHRGHATTSPWRKETAMKRKSRKVGKRYAFNAVVLSPQRGQGRAETEPWAAELIAEVYHLPIPRRRPRV